MIGAEVGVVHALCDVGTDLEGMSLIHTPTLPRKMRKPRFLSKKEVRGKRSTASKLVAEGAEIESQQMIMNDIIFRNEPGIRCLSCENEAYVDDLWFGFGKIRVAARGYSAVSPSHKERRTRVAARGGLVVPPSHKKRTS